MHETTKRDGHKKRSSITLYPPLHEQLKNLAKQNDRPVLWELRRAVAQYLKQNGIEPILPETD